MRKLLLLGVIVGCSTALPIIYEADPDLFHGMLRDSAPAEEQPVQIAMVAPRQHEPGARQLTGRRVEVTMDRNGHFLSEFRLNGRRVDAMIDTGATVVALNRSTASRIGIHLTHADFKLSVNTANGPAPAAPAMIRNLQIGRINVEDVQAVVLDDASLNGTLIGMSFLARLGRFRVENRVLTLEQ